METGAPNPAIMVTSDRLTLAYVCHNPLFSGWDSGESIEHPGFDVYSAVLEFTSVREHFIGGPSDERLEEHPLFSIGLRPYGFYELLESPKAGTSHRHWIITFHDELFEVVAVDARVLRARVDGEDTSEIVRRLRPC
jgi:hypothetical protein